MTKTAILSDDKVYRYELKRVFDNTKPLIAFVGLNPSTADDVTDDQTISKCIKYAENWGFGGFIMVNLFAFRATNPNELYKAENPVGIDNDKYLQEAFGKVEKVICCWGEMGNFKGRNAEVLKLIEKPYCLFKVKNGEPAHPLYKDPNLTPSLYYDTDLSSNFFEWNGFCPESILEGNEVRMRHNSNDFFESEKTGLQVAIMFPGVQAVVMNFRGEGKFRQTAKYADEVFNSEILSKQTSDKPPFCDIDLIQDEKTLREYLATIK